MPPVDGLLPVFAALGGIVLGLLLRQVVAATSIRTATSRAQGLLEEARQQQIGMVIAAKGDIARLRAEADGLARNEREALAAESERVRLREIAHEERETFFVQREASIAERERASFEEAAVLAAAKASVTSRLAEVAGLDPEAART